MAGLVVGRPNFFEHVRIHSDELPQITGQIVGTITRVEQGLQLVEAPNVCSDLSKDTRVYCVVRGILQYGPSSIARPMIRAYDMTKAAPAVCRQVTGAFEAMFQGPVDYLRVGLGSVATGSRTMTH